MASDDAFTFKINRIPRAPQPSPAGEAVTEDQPRPPRAAGPLVQPAPSRDEQRSETDFGPSSFRTAFSPPPPPPDIASPLVGAQFSGPAATLSFLAAVAGARLAREATCRRDVAADGLWWAEVRAPVRPVAQLAWTSGGRPFVLDAGRWRAVALSEGSPDAAHGSATIDIEDYQPVDPTELLAQVPLRRRASLATATALTALVPGALGRWVLRRAAALDVSMEVAPVTRTPLREGGAQSSALIIRLRARQGVIPTALIHAISSLPFTTIAQPIGPDGTALLVDVWHRAHAVESLLGGMIPPGEMWVLGAPDVGHFRVRPTGAPIDGDALLQPPSAVIAEMPALGTAASPTPIPVRLVARAGGAGRVDGVLLDDAELRWVRPFLMGHPESDLCFLVLGPGKHLLTAPGGLPGMTPVGLPLTRVGPGGLYLEQGMELFPPLPEAARRQAFDLRTGSAVAVSRDGAYRFEERRMVPAWALWAGAAPAIESGLSPEAERLLDIVSQSTGEDRQRLVFFLTPLHDTERHRERVQFIEQAQRSELAGELLRAAELLEAAGEPAAAARLYEQATRE